MSFFAKYNGTTNKRLLRIERLVWPLIYGGLLVLVLAYFTEMTQGTDATLLYAGGGIAVVLGLVAFYLRSRHPDE